MPKPDKPINATLYHLQSKIRIDGLGLRKIDPQSPNPKLAKSIAEAQKLGTNILIAS